MKEHLKDNRVSEHTKKLFKTVNYRVRNKPVEHKYYRKDAMVVLDYNLLENQYVVRRYIQKKWNMSFRELEILLYLFPKGYFSHRDYKDFPSSFTHRQIKSMIKLGHVQIFVEGPNLNKHIYSLTKGAQTKVQNYYKYLTGELTIPTTSAKNPMIRKDASSHDKKVISMFHKLAAKNKTEKESE